EMRDSVSMPIAVEASINEPPAQWVCKKDVLAYVSALLDSANTALGAAGAAFAVTIPSGYRAVAGTPAGFAKFNRGIKGKVEIYRGLATGGPNNVSGNSTQNFNDAIAALNASFMDATTLT